MSVVIVVGILVAGAVVVILVIVVTVFGQRSKSWSPTVVTTFANDNHELSVVQTDIEKPDSNGVDM